MAPKSIENRRKFDVEKRLQKSMIFEEIFDRFLMDPEPSVTLIFSLSSRREWKNQGLGFLFLHYFSSKILNEFCIDFSTILAPKSLPKRFRKHAEKSHGFWNDF